MLRLRSEVGMKWGNKAWGEVGMKELEPGSAREVGEDAAFARGKHRDA